MNKQELTKILELHEKWLRGEPDGVRANLAHANLYHAHLAHANLAHANLTDANLYHANLAHANLYHANLTDANLYHANLAHANLYHANLTYANLYHANLRGGVAVGEVIFLSHLKYFIIAYVTERGKKIIEIGCQCKTVYQWRKAIRVGEFSDEKDFIDQAWGYFLAVEKDLNRIKKEVL